MHRTRHEFLLASSKSNEDQAKLLELPVTSGGEHLLIYLNELGYVELGSNVSPLSWSTINAWQSTLKDELSTWEILTLHDLSVEYFKMLSMAKSSICPPPGKQQVEVEQLGSKLRSIMDSFKKARGKKQPKRVKVKTGE